MGLFVLTSQPIPFFDQKKIVVLMASHSMSDLDFAGDRNKLAWFDDGIHPIRKQGTEFP